MRITSTITSEGERWSVKFPTIDGAKCFPLLNGRETAQPDSCLAELARLERDERGVQGVTSDKPFLNCSVCAWIKMLNEWKGDNYIGEDAPNYKRTITRIDRKFAADRVSYARADWTLAWNAQNKPVLRLRLSVKGNDRIVERHDWARIWAWKMAEAAKALSDDFAAGGQPPIELCENTRAYLAEYRAFCDERKRERFVKWTNERRLICLCHRNGYCSPIHPKCRHCKLGKCVEVAE